MREASATTWRKLRWAEQKGYKTEIYETSYAEEAGIKSTACTRQ
ncbi:MULTISPECIES: hypothetical protein [Streptomyces]|nr:MULTISPECIES: hypothetical protein [Streptomyces]